MAMYDYDRTASPRARNYVEAVQQAEKAYGVKPGSERKAADAKRIARDLDREVSHGKGISDDDAWAHDSTKAEKLWKELQKLFQYLFGYDPPKLGTV